MKRYEALTKVYLPCGIMGFVATWFSLGSLRIALFVGVIPLAFWWVSEIYLELRK